MPTYDYECSVCGELTAHYNIDFEKRTCPRLCSECNGTAHYTFTPTKGVIVHEAHYDEGLGVDVGGPRERKQVMNALGLEEAGDPVGGARNQEGKSEGISAPRGVKLSDRQYKDEAAVKARNNKMVTTIGKDGKETKHRVGDLSTDHRKAVRQGSKSIGKGKK